MAIKVKIYIESIHAEAVEKYNEPGENFLDEWLEYTIWEIESLLSEIDSMIDKYNCQCVAHTDMICGKKIMTIYDNYLRVVK